MKRFSLYIFLRIIQKLVLNASLRISDIQIQNRIRFGLVILFNSYLRLHSPHDLLTLTKPNSKVYINKFYFTLISPQHLNPQRSV